MNNKLENPWLLRLPVHASDSELNERMKLPIQRISDLSKTPPHAARRLLDKHLDAVYVPTAQGLKLTRKVLESGYAYCLGAYKNKATFVQRLMNTTAKPESEPETWMITGDAGIGKTATINALKRLLGEGPTFQPSTDCPTVPIVGGAFLTLKSRSGFADLLTQLAIEIGYYDRIEKVGPNAKHALRNELYKRGVFFVLLDESQVAATGRQAGAAYVNNLMWLRDFGLPLIYACNYSMVHGMLGQHAQNQQRLLMNPFVFRPTGLTDPDFLVMLQAYVDACNGLLKIDMNRDIEEIHRLSDGRGRPLRLLIATAYYLQREKGKTKVCVGRGELQEAYCSDAYSVLRKEIEAIKKHRVEKSGLRSDLLYPLALETGTDETARSAVRAALQAAAAGANIRDSMSRAEKKSGVVSVEETVGDCSRQIGIAVTKVEKSAPTPKIDTVSKSASKKSRSVISDQDVDDAWA